MLRHAVASIPTAHIIEMRAALPVHNGTCICLLPRPDSRVLNNKPYVSHWTPSMHASRSCCACQWYKTLANRLLFWIEEQISTRLSALTAGNCSAPEGRGRLNIAAGRFCSDQVTGLSGFCGKSTARLLALARNRVQQTIPSG
jgi:hypothetical protein